MFLANGIRQLAYSPYLTFGIRDWARSWGGDVETPTATSTCRKTSGSRMSELGGSRASLRGGDNLPVSFPLLVIKGELCDVGRQNALLLGCAKSVEVVEPDAGVALDLKKDKSIIFAIHQVINDDFLVLISKKKSMRETWEALKSLHIGARMQQLCGKFKVLKMSNLESIDEFINKLSSLVDQMCGLNQKINE